MVQHLTRFLITGRTEEFLNRVYSVGLYPFPLTQFKFSADGTGIERGRGSYLVHLPPDRRRIADVLRSEPVGMLWSELLQAENGLPLLKASSVVSLVQCLVSDYSGTSIHPSSFIAPCLLSVFLTNRS